ncbi:TIGR02391 family protein [Pseudomonas sp. 21LCFQ02]|uniref:TIGR02391 family protein n=1 Tax=Pseudomonas sp. 21LCFQ02 TaxID=2957505 RepID=UPI00209A68C1|nr:TIGR02391 family protein [Pseudomonas sp. 21LCFQ02]MCO8168643.1 TIGR02391 family protein [Pseudomonas sp. 21LCFQ02]
MVKKIDMSKLAGIEYHGTPGVTQRCIDALKNILGAGEHVQAAWILSWFDGKIGEHSILLTLSPCLRILIKSGFRSGYSGTGPTGFSTAIELLQLFKVDIEEYDIDEELHRRCEAGCLLSSDLKSLTQAMPVRPMRYYEYIECPSYRARTDVFHLLEEFPPVLNLGLLDERLVDLSIGFFDNPDSAITTAFRRLEDIVRTRIGVYDKSSTQLFTHAFEGSRSVLHWDDQDAGEQAGKCNLFKSVTMAYRNPRAHREVKMSNHDAVRELMLVNQLYLLEAAAVPRLIQDIKLPLEKYSG